LPLPPAGTLGKTRIPAPRACRSLRIMWRIWPPCEIKSCESLSCAFQRAWSRRPQLDRAMRSARKAGLIRPIGISPEGLGALFRVMQNEPYRAKPSARLDHRQTEINRREQPMRSYPGPVCYSRRQIADRMESASGWLCCARRSSRFVKMFKFQRCFPCLFHCLIHRREPGVVVGRGHIMAHDVKRPRRVLDAARRSMVLQGS
jgi:hypothetical protein